MKKDDQYLIDAIKNFRRQTAIKDNLVYVITDSEIDMNYAYYLLVNGKIVEKIRYGTETKCCFSTSVLETDSDISVKFFYKDKNKKVASIIESLKVEPKEETVRYLSDDEFLNDCLKKLKNNEVDTVQLALESRYEDFNDKLRSHRYVQLINFAKNNNYRESNLQIISKHAVLLHEDRYTLVAHAGISIENGNIREANQIIEKLEKEYNFEPEKIIALRKKMNLNESIRISKEVKLDEPYEIKNILKESYVLLDKKMYSFDVELGEFYFNFKAFNDQNEVKDNSALISLHLYDEYGTALLPIDSFPVNQNVGPYIYIESGASTNPIFNEFVIEINDPKAAKLELYFHAWKKEVKTYIEDSLNVSFLENNNTETKLQGVYGFIEELKPEDKVILLYTTAPYVEHETLELRPNRMAKEYIKLGYKVIFFSFSRVPEELAKPQKYDGHLYQCLFEDIVNVSSFISHKKFREKIFICSSFPGVLALTTMNKLKLNSWKLVYEIRDDMEEFNRVGYSKWYDSKLETAVIKIADKVITVSPRLAQKAKVMAGIAIDSSQKVIVIQNAAPDALIDKTKYLRTIEVARERNASNRVGYIGHLTPAWFDWSLIINSAKLNPDIVYEIIGHGTPKGLDLPSNIVCLGPKTHDEFIEISRGWRVGLIPFIKSPLTYGVDPNKIYEYLSVGLMVVTADMGSVRQCPATYVYEKDNEFNDLLNQVLNTNYTENIVKKIQDYVSHARWSLRASELLKEILV